MVEIRIVQQGDGYYTVYQGDRYQNNLTWDEMLAQVVEVSHPTLIRERKGRGMFGMSTDEERIAKLRDFWIHFKEIEHE